MASRILSTDSVIHGRLIIRSVSFCLKARRIADIFYQKDRQFLSPDNSRSWVPGGSPYTASYHWNQSHCCLFSEPPRSFQGVAGRARADGDTCYCHLARSERKQEINKYRCFLGCPLAIAGTGGAGIVHAELPCLVGRFLLSSNRAGGAGTGAWRGQPVIHLRGCGRDRG